MTDAVTSLLTTPTRPTTKRDQWGRYLLVDPATGNERPYTRATTVAKVLSDDHNLTQWAQRMVANGIGKRPELYALACATPLDDKRTLNDLCEKAAVAAGSGSKADLGTALHSFTERYELGETLAQIGAPEPWNRDLAAYAAKLDADGVRIERDGVERILAVHSLGIAGTTDRLRCWLRGRRLPLIGDVKTGGSLNEKTGKVELFSAAWNEIAIQLAIYANADTVYNMATGENDPMPEVDRTRALVIHLPVGQAVCDLYLVDIEAGWEALQHAHWVHGTWRKRKNLATLYAAPDVDASASTLPPATVEQIEAVRLRARSIIDTGHGAELAAGWPDGVPTLKQGGQTVEQLETIGRVCADVERVHDLPFIQDSTATPEFVPGDDERVLAIRERLDVLPSDLVSVVGARALEQQCPKLSSGRATPNDVRIVDGIVTDVEAIALEREAEVVALLADWIEDEEVVESLCAAAGVTDDRGVRQFTAVEVDRLRTLVEAIDLCVVGFTFEGETPVLSTTEQADAYIVKRYGSKRDALTAAKQVATSLGKSKPRSVSAALEDPLLVAHVATLNLDNTTGPATTEETTE